MKFFDSNWNPIKRIRCVPTDAFRKVEDWLLPERCLQCKNIVAAGEAYCHACYLTLPFQADACTRCGQIYLGNGESCGRCISNPPPQEITFYPFSYKPPISDAIQQLKYSQRPAHARRLAALLAAEIIATGIDMPDLIVPVPMHLSRLRQRGYNQAALICKYLAGILQIECDLYLLSKVRNTAPQVELTLSQRQKNTCNSFKVRKTPRHGHIAVIDDVLTTGSTVAEVCKVLKKGGVKTVQVWTLAHTL